MRKGTAISMAIVLVALVAMMVAADMAIRPMKHVLRVGRDLTAVLEARADIRKGSKVVTVARAPEERHLAQDGWGMVIELEPSTLVLTRRGRLTRLAHRAATEAGRLYGQSGKPLQWFELRMQVAEGVQKRTLVKVDEHGRLSRPDPALPETYPELSVPTAAHTR